MSNLIPGLLDSARLLFDLQRGNAVAQSFSGSFDPEQIARCVTDGLVEKFGCAFARIWLVEDDRAFLRLVASSGLYTRTTGSFAKVPMGAYKVGKIAQNRISFLSNNLSEEAWVKDREWAIANNIRGFAGYPLTAGDRVVGVVAVFSYEGMAPEFLEVLQFLCTTVAIALETARHQQEKQIWQPVLSLSHQPLSEQLADILQSVRLTLIGTEQPLALSTHYLVLQVAERLKHIECSYCRLIYSAEGVALEAIVAAAALPAPEEWVRSQLGMLVFAVSCVGGILQSQIEANRQMIQILLKIPYFSASLGTCLRVQCRQPVLQLAFTHLAYAAGLTVCSMDAEAPLLTDDPALLTRFEPVLWIQQGAQAVPKGVKSCIDLTASAADLRQAVEAVRQGKAWGNVTEGASPLSDREQEIMMLLAQGLRDRDIASRLIISESTVKFHINNSLKKLKAQTRYQALHQAMIKGWFATLSI